MDGKTEGRLHNIAHSAWLTGKSWEVTAWLLCNQDVTEINVKNRTLLPVKVSELIKEMIFSMFVAATALSPDEFRHFVSGRGSVGAVRLDEWDLKSHLSDRCLGLFRPCGWEREVFHLQTSGEAMMTAGLTSPRGGEEPRGAVKKWISGSAAVHSND